MIREASRNTWTFRPFLLIFLLSVGFLALGSTQALNLGIKSQVKSQENTRLSYNAKSALCTSRAPRTRIYGWGGVSETRVPHEEEIIDGVLSKFDAKSSVYIPLSNKNINDIGGAFKSKQSTVRQLDLENNKLSELKAESFLGLDALEELKLAGNVITTVEKDAFKGLKNLKTLSLARNPLKELPEGIFTDLKNLTSLTLHSVPLKSIDPKVFAPLHSLRKLHMYNTDVEEIPEEFFDLLPNLEVLSMHMGQVPRLPEDFLLNMPNLEELSVDGQALPLENTDRLFEAQRKLRHVYLFGKTTEEIFLKVRGGLADSNNCKVIVQENPNIGPGYSFT